MMKLSAVLLASAIALSTALPTRAAPIQVPVAQATAGSGDVQEIRHRRGHYSHNRMHYRRGYYNGYHGSNYYRRGYHRHNDGWWYPLAAFGAGAIIGGAITSQPRVVDGGINPRHVEWCFSRYRTYRSYDNTYVPRAGVRAQCYSPYY